MVDAINYKCYIRLTPKRRHERLVWKMVNPSKRQGLYNDQSDHRKT